MQRKIWLGVVTGFSMAMASVAQGQVTYVDASSTNTVGVVSGLADWFTGADMPPTTGPNSSTQWKFRNGQATGGVWEATNSSTLPADAPQLNTTVAVPNGTYDVYVFYLSDAAPNWQIRAGLSPGTVTLYDTDGSVGTAGATVFGGLDPITFDGIGMTDDAQQVEYYALLGQSTVTNGMLNVYIDDLPTTSLPGGSPVLDSRTWYDGIGYAVPVPELEINSVQTGLASAASTWDNNEPPSPANLYNVLATHTVTLDQSFLGKRLTVESGGAVDISASNADIKRLVVEPGASLTESVSGSFILGMPTVTTTPLGILELEEDVAFNVGAGETFVIGLAVHGEGDVDLNTGAGSIVRLADSELHEGVIRFNGSGDEFTLEWNRDFHHVEMNSTGANKFSFLQAEGVAEGTLVFNQPGTVSHATMISAPLSRLIAPDVLEANATVTVDLTAPYTAGANSERRLQFSQDFLGTGDIIVQGMTTDPSSLPAGVGLHEFELGGQGEPSGAIEVDSYSGTLTANNYVNVELRHSLPAARIVVNANARFEMGHDVTDTAKSLVFGEVQINSGGTLEIGHEDSLASSTGHQVGHLRLASTAGRSGDLTLTQGSKTAIQLNGTAANQFDTIVAEGDIVLDGTLEIWLNPPSTNATANPTFTPAVDDTFVIMSVAAATLPADFDDNNMVDGLDLDVWKGAFGMTADGDADGDGDTDGADFLQWQRGLGQSSSIGTITGVVDAIAAPAETPWPGGLAFQVNIIGNDVVLKVISAATGAAAAVPEPSTVGLAASAGAIALALARRRRGATESHC